MSRAASLLAVVLGGAAVGAIAATARTPPEGPSREELDRIAAELEASMRETAAAASSRAQTLADLPRLALAVATDAPTVRDLTDDELAFRPGPDETIEIAQVVRGEPTSLLRVPEGSEVEVPLAPGIHLIAKDGLRIAAIAKVEPRARADELHGVVAVTRSPDLQRVMTRLKTVGGARLETAGGVAQLGRPLDRARGITAMMLSPGVDEPVRLVLPAPGEATWDAGRLGLAGGLAAFMIVIAAILWRRRSHLSARADALTVMAWAEPDLPTVAEYHAELRPAVPEGRRIGNYRVLRRLGTGGMADVFLARIEGEAGFERRVALKVIQDEMASNPRVIDRFLDEARVASRLNHPNLVAITDLGKVDGQYLIAMEYIDGADLEHLLHGAAARRALIPVGVALAIARHICDGLHFAHTALDGHGEPLHVVHRDVKSANVFVSRNGEVKVGDFGIAKVASRMRTARTEIGEVKGTAAYMAPEQRAGWDVDLRADVYAVGALCYELLTGRIINLDLAMLAHLGRSGWPHLDPPSAVRPALPPELDEVVFRSMAFDRNERYPTCQALQEALAEIVDRHGLGVTDRAIAQWITEELAAQPDRPEVTDEAVTRIYDSGREPALGWSPRAPATNT